MRTFFVAPCVILGVVFSVATTALAQMPTYTTAGPVPSALAAAKTIFVSNAGSDSGLYSLYLGPFTGDPDRPYTEFYSALKATGDYTLAADPAQADLVLELSLTAHNDRIYPYKQNGVTDAVPSPSSTDPLPMFRLVVCDGKSHYILWTITHPIDFAYLQKNHDKNFDAALASVLNQFLQISGKTPVPAH